MKPPAAEKHDDVGPAGGWGSLKGMAAVFARERATPGVLETLARQNKAGGYACSSCAWGKPAHPNAFEFCENGAKSTIWELTTDRCTPEFFARYSVTELRNWSDFDLEMQGRLTEPLRYNATSDHYERCTWNEAFVGIAAQLQALAPKSVVFYASGKASLETSYLYGLLARFYGNNNLPDSSNMCHETTSVGLQKVIGTSVGTCLLEDFEHCDAIFYMGQNPGTNSPRFLHPLQEAVKRGCKIITFNPVREQGLLEFVNPQNPLEMLTGHATQLSHMYLQVRPGGDMAAIMGICKQVLAVDAQRTAAGQPGVLDRLFIAEHTRGFEAFEACVHAASWVEIQTVSGLQRVDLEQAGDVYAAAERVIGVYGMGLTQQVHGTQTIGLLVNLLLMRGNIGRQGAGICPVRGHSNVQGQRTVGISEKPELVPLDTMAAMFDFEPPRDTGLTTVDACQGIRDGSVQAFIGLGGNFVRAIPERDAMEAAWTNMALTVSVAIKLNRTHVLPGQTAYLLPCLARSEEDMQASGRQAVSIEDSFSHIHGSVGKRQPASPLLLSELAIVAGIAKATLASHPKWCWDAWTADYGVVRNLIEQTWPEQFKNYNARLFDSGGFYRGNSAHNRQWETDSGKAEFTVPTVMSALGVGPAPGRYHLITMRSNDQFNTTIYGFSDRLRGLEGSRAIVLINPADMARAGLQAGDKVSLLSDAGDDVHREVPGLTVMPFNLPDGCLGGYYPEMNPLIPLWYHDAVAKTPASKGVPVRLEKTSAR